MTPRIPRPENLPVCEQCGAVHVTNHGQPACTGHVAFDRESYVPGQPRKRLDKPRACKQPRVSGVTVCYVHGGGSKKVRAVGGVRVAEKQIIEAARKLVPDVAERTAITNPLETLLELASEANAFRESLRIMANELDGKIRYAAGGGSGEQLRAEVAIYRQALKDTTDLLVAIARLDIENTLARIESRKVELVLAAMTSGLNAAGLNDEQKRAVMEGVGRHLRSVPRSAA